MTKGAYVKNESFGFTLTELLVGIALVLLIATMAWPVWQTHMTHAKEALLIANIQSMAIFQEDYRMRYGRYATDLVDREAIRSTLGWAPKRNHHVTYSIAAAEGADYVVYALSSDGHSICLRMPAALRCDP